MANNLDPGVTVPAESSQSRRRHAGGPAKLRGSRAANGADSAPMRLASLVPYGGGARVIRRMSRSWLLQQTLFRRNLQHLEQVLELLGRPVDHDRAVYRHLMGKGNKWTYRWRLSMAGRADWSSLKEWFPVTGLAILDHARATGRGVILVNSHFGGGRFVPLILARSGMPFLSLEASNKFEALGVVFPDRVQVIQLKDSFLARAVLQAERALKEGKVLHLAADGLTGKSRIPVTFLGRAGHFTAGFAELAVNTNAIVLPVFAPFDEEGRVNIEFVEPLDIGRHSTGHSERVESLVKQYGRLLEQRWYEDPGNILAGKVRKFLRSAMTNDLVSSGHKPPGKTSALRGRSARMKMQTSERNDVS